MTSDASRWRSAFSSATSSYRSSNHSESTSSLGWQTDDMNVASESASSQKSASTLPRRSSGKLIERLCSRGDTFKRAIDIYNSVKDQEQFKEKSCLPNVCALIASESLGNLDVKWEDAWEASKPLTEGHFWAVLRSVRVYLRTNRNCQTVTFAALLAAYHVYPGKQYVATQFMSIFYDDFVKHHSDTPVQAFQLGAYDEVVCGIFYHVCTDLFEKPGVNPWIECRNLVYDYGIESQAALNQLRVSMRNGRYRLLKTELIQASVCSGSRSLRISLSSIAVLQNYLKYAPTHHDSTHADHLQPILSQIFNGPLEQAKRPHLPVINVQTLSPDSHPFSHATSSQVGRRSSGAGQSVAVPPSSISIAQGVSNLERPKITAVASPLASSSQSESVVPTVHLDVPTHRKSVTPQIYRTEATTITAPDPEILSQHVTNNVPSASTSGSLPSKNSSPENVDEDTHRENVQPSTVKKEVSDLATSEPAELRLPTQSPKQKAAASTVSTSSSLLSRKRSRSPTHDVRRDRVKPKKEVDVIDLTTPEPEARIPAQPPQRRDAGLSASSSDHLPLKRSGTSNPEVPFIERPRADPVSRPQAASTASVDRRLEILRRVNDALQAVIKHVEEHGCSDLLLEAKVLELIVWTQKRDPTDHHSEPEKALRNAERDLVEYVGNGFDETKVGETMYDLGAKVVKLGVWLKLRDRDSTM